MLKMLKTLKPELRGRRLYVFETTKFGMWIYTELAYYGVQVAGFVTETPEFVGETLLGLPVVGIDAWRADGDALLVMRRGASDQRIESLQAPGRCLRVQDLLVIDPQLAGRGVYLYGAGHEAWSMLARLERAGIGIRGFVETEKPADPVRAGIPKLKFSEHEWGADDVIVLATKLPYPANEIIRHVGQQGFPGELRVDRLHRDDDYWGLDWAPMLDEAMKRGKRILLCYDTEMDRELATRLLRSCGVEVDRACDAEGIWDFADEDPSECLLVTVSFSDMVRCDMVEAAYDMGFLFCDHSLTSLHPATRNRRFVSGQLAYEYDPIMGQGIDYTCEGGLPGWAVYGDAACEGARIMVLGGSTSSEVYVDECWPSKLHRLLEADGIEHVIFNGAHEMNAAFDELKRLLRDVDGLRPTIVISMSGVNDRKQLVNKFDLFRGGSTFEAWRKTELQAKLIAESAGAQFYCFYQPMNMTMPEESLSENIFFGNAPCGNNVFAYDTRDDDFYIDLHEMFWHREGMYVDLCHYSDAGNAEIARAVYDAIKESL